MRSVLPRILVLVSLTAVVVPAAMGPASALPPPSTVAPAATSQPAEVQPANMTTPETSTAATDPADTTGVLSEATLADAQQTAKATGERVEVRSMRTETETTWANPSGSLTTDVASGPVRTRTDAQSPWEPVDLDLQPAAEGLVPAAGPVDVVLSDGQPGPAVDLTRGSGSLGLSWPAPLPAPRVSGQVAEYDLGDGVRLQLTATDAGALVRVVLAHEPAPAPVWRLPLRMNGLDVAQRSDGSFVFTDTAEKAVFEIAAPQMWDSAPTPEGAPRTTQPVTSRIVRDAGGVFLELAPSAAFLTDPDTVYPLTVDPDIASVQRAGDTYVQQNVTAGRGAAAELFTGILNGDKQRSFVKFDTSSLDGTQILDAQLKLYNHFSGSCNATLFNVRPVNEAWPNPMVWTNQPGVALGDAYLVQKRFAHGNAGEGCPADAFVSLNVTPIVAERTDQDGTLDVDNGFRLTSDEEFEKHRKVFCSNDVSTDPADKPCSSNARRPTLSVTYNSTPNVPTARSTVPSTPCVTGASRPAITSSRPTLKATVSDPDGGILYGKFVVAPTGDAAHPVATGQSAAVASGSTASWQVPAGKLVPGANYSWRVQGYDLQRSSAFTSWCEFTLSLPAPQLDTPTTLHDTGAELSWPVYSNPTEPAAEYQIHRSTTAGFTPTDGTRVKTLGLSKTSYTDAGVDPAAPTATTGGTYYYRLVVKTTNGALVPSAPQMVQLPVSGRTTKILTGPTVVNDTTISSSQPGTNLDSVGGQPVLKAGSGDTTYGTTRALLDPDLSGVVPAGARVMDAQLRLWATGVSGTGGSLAAHTLSRDFAETTATWNSAATNQAWTAPGGDFTSPAAGTTAVTGAGAWHNLNVTGAVAHWVSVPADNHGLLVKKATETGTQTVTFASSEATDPTQRPRLMVTYLNATASATYYAPFTPQLMAPNDDETVTVTITNTTDTTWKVADWVLSYHWLNPDGSEYSTPPDNPQPPTGVLTQDVAPGQSLSVARLVQPPVNALARGARSEWLLAWDLRNVSGPSPTWLSQSATPVPPLTQQVTVEDAGQAAQVGLEDYLQYTGQPTGAASALLANAHNGDAVWSYNAFSNPSRGLNTFLRLTYNSSDVTNDAAGFRWSVSAATLSRLGTPLAFSQQNQQFPDTVTLTDGDGTSHVFAYNPVTGEYRHPPGVHLFLQRLTPTDPDDKRAWVFTAPDRTKFYFDADGYQLSTVDKNGNTLTFQWNPPDQGSEKKNLQLTGITDTEGRTTMSLDYYVNHQAYSWVDANGAVQSGTDLTDPDIIGQLASVTDITTATEPGRQVSFTYTDTGQLARLVDGAGDPQAKVFKFGYEPGQVNTNSKLIAITDPRASDPADTEGHTTRLSYYAPPPGEEATVHWRVATITDREDKLTNFGYVDPDAEAGEAIDTTVTDANNHATVYRTDAFGRPTTITNAQNKTTLLTWDSDHNVVLLQEPPAQIGGTPAVTTWAYDQNTGYPLVIIDAVANNMAPGPDTTPLDSTKPRTLLTYAFQLNGHVADLTAKTSPKGSLTTANNNDFTWNFGYDPAGNLTTVTDPEGVASTTVAADFQTSYTYDGLGNLTSLTDANEHTTGYSDFDANGYPATITDAKNFTTQVGYDSRGHVTSVTDPHGNTSRYEYDLFGRPGQTTQPLNDATTDPAAPDVDIITKAPTYDRNDNILRSFAPYFSDNVPTQFTSWDSTYDGMDRALTSIEPLDKTGDPQRTTSYTYDPVGNLKTLTEPNASLPTSLPGRFVTTYTYDSLDQLQTMARINDAGANLITRYTYYDNGDLRAIIDPNKEATADPSDFTTAYAYDLNHRVATVTDAAGEQVVYGYDDDGQMDSVINQADQETTATYDMRGLLTSVTVPHDPGGAMSDRTTGYTYDEVGNQTKVISPRGMATGQAGDFLTEYTYDALNRVDQVLLPDNPARSGFDPESDPQFIDYDYDSLSNLTQVSTPPSGRNVGGIEGSNGVRADTAYTHFATGWTKSSTDPFDITTSYSYNPMGQQTSRTVTAAGDDVADEPADTRTMTWGYYPDGKLASRQDSGLPAHTPVVLVDNSDLQNTNADTVTGWDQAADDETAGTKTYQGYDYLTHDAGAAGGAFTWRLSIPEAGSYKVFVRAGTEATATNASYTIKHNGTQDTPAPISQATNHGQWKSLGTTAYTFSKGTNGQQITLSPQADGTLAADAVKLVRNRAVGETDNEEDTYTYTYDPNANLTQVRDDTSKPVPQIGVYDIGYSSLNQVKTVAEKPTAGATATKTTSYTYDPAGNLTDLVHDWSASSTPNADQTSHYTYDVRDLLSKVEVTSNKDPDSNLPTPDPRTTSFTYNPLGLRATQTNDNHNLVTYTYYADQLLKSQTETKNDAPHTVVSSHDLTYTPNGDRASDKTRLMNATNNNAYLDFTRFYTYNAQDRVTGVDKRATDDPTSALLESEQYSYDDAGNITEQTVEDKTTDFVYDRNRLLQATTNGVTADYNYDPTGRLDTVIAGTADPDDLTDPNDAAGAAGMVLESYDYDGFGHVTKYTKNFGTGPITTTYNYDPLDRTTSRTRNPGTPSAKTTEFTYLGLSDTLISEIDKTTNTLAKTYQYTPWGERLSQIKHTPTGGAEASFYGYNPHTDVETITTSTGGTRATYGYTAYGQDDKQAFTGVDKPDQAVTAREPYNPYRYTAKRYDEVSGNLDMGFRDYAPGLNRFLTLDTYNGALNDLGLGTDPWTTNRYALAGGNPITGIELDGHRLTAGTNESVEDALVSIDHEVDSALGRVHDHSGAGCPACTDYASRASGNGGGTASSGGGTARAPGDGSGVGAHTVYPAFVGAVHIPARPYTFTPEEYGLADFFSLGITDWLREDDAVEEEPQYTRGQVLGALMSLPGLLRGAVALGSARIGSQATRASSAAESATTAERTVVIGRNMAGRVRPYAEKNGYDVYGGTPKWIPRGLQRVAPRTLDRVDLWFNKRWINSEMRAGSRVMDIGEPPGMPPSDFYNMELQQVDGYWNYFKDLQP
jgi:RHS repeat-associated protein